MEKTRLEAEDRDRSFRTKEQASERSALTFQSPVEASCQRAFAKPSLTGIALAILVGLLTATPAKAQVRFFDNEAEWRAAVFNIQEFETTADNLTLAEEITTSPLPNEQLCGLPPTEDCKLTLSFPALELSFELEPLQPGAGLTFNDTEGADPAWREAISIGDISNFEDDDFEIRITADPSSSTELTAIGFYLVNSSSSDGEFLEIYSGIDLLRRINGLTIPSSDGQQFVGLVSTEPITRVRYEEDPDGDDIAIRDFRLGQQKPLQFFFDEDEWRAAVDSVEELDTTAANLALSGYCGAPPCPDPGANEQLCGTPPDPDCTLSFDQGSTGLTRSFELEPLQAGAGLTFDDTEGFAEVWREAISIGDIDNYQNDDFEIRVIDGSPASGVGFYLVDSVSASGESLEVYGDSGLLGGLDGLEIPSSADRQFVGVVSIGEPITRVAYNEGAGGDDIGIRDFRFAPGDSFVSVIEPSGGAIWQLSGPPGLPNTEVISWVLSADICYLRVVLDYSPDGGASWLEASSAAPIFESDVCGTSMEELPTFLNYALPSDFADLFDSSPTGEPAQFEYRIRIEGQTAGALSTVEDESEPFSILGFADPSIKTLIVWHSERMRRFFPSPNLEGPLQDLASQPQVSGRVVDLSEVSRLAPLYNAWDADPSACGDHGLANAVLFDTDGIHELLREYLEVLPAVEYLVLVGDDRIVPMARLEDRTEILTEANYASALPNDTSTVACALEANQYLSDDPIATKTPVQLDGDGSVLVPRLGATCSDGDKEKLVFIPDLAVGRLVETPAEIEETLQMYAEKSGILDLSVLDPQTSHKVLVTGYDFLVDSAEVIRQQWTSFLGDDPEPTDLAPVDGQLVSEDWGHDNAEDRKQALETHLCGNGGDPYAIASFSGHADHLSLGVPAADVVSGSSPYSDIQGLSTTDLISGNTCDSGLDLTGGVAYAVGCHSGLPVPGSEPASQDVPQTLLSLGAQAYIGNTGYGWGLFCGRGYGERLAEILTEELTAGDIINLGEAVRRSKQRYFLEDSGCFDTFDQKSVMQWTYYGLPMYQLSTGTGVPLKRAFSGSAPQPGERPALEQFGGVSVSRQLSGGAAGSTPTEKSLPQYLTRLELGFEFGDEAYKLANADDSGLCHTDAEGQFYRLNGLATGSSDVPIQPYFVYDSRLSGTSQHGVLWTGGSYTEKGNWQPLFGELISNQRDRINDHGVLADTIDLRPGTTNLTPGTVEAEEDGACRALDTELNSLIVPTGSVRSTPGAGQLYDVQRLFEQISLEVFYFNNTDDESDNCHRTGPTMAPTDDFDGEYHQAQGPIIEWRVDAKGAVDPADPDEIWRVVVVHDLRQASTVSDGDWQAVELSPDNNGIWTASLSVTDIWPDPLTTNDAPILRYVIQAVDRRGNVSWLEFEPTQVPQSGVPSSLARVIETGFDRGNADLAISLVDAPDPLPAGGQLIYNITVVNTSTEAANALRVTQNLPEGAGLVIAGGNDWTCSDEPTGKVTLVICERPRLEAGEESQITALVNTPAIAGLLTSTVVVEAFDLDSNLSNNIAIAQTEVIGDQTADLELQKSAPETVEAGEPILYTLTVTNHGPTEADGVTVTESLPVELTGAVTSGCLNDPTGALVCSLGSLAPGASKQFTLTAVVDAGAIGELINSASVLGDDEDPDPTNNVAEAVTRVMPAGPPSVVGIERLGPNGGPITECSTLSGALRRLRVAFSEEVADPAGDDDPDDVTNPANYMLLAPGPDAAFATDSCAGGISSDDQLLEIESVRYDAASASAELALGARPLADGLYRLLVCGSTSITDLAGQALNGGSDHLLGFRIDRFNRLANAHFDDCPVTLTPWIVDSVPPNEVMASAEDVDASLLSGAAHLAHLSSDPTTLGQCLEVDPGTDYEQRVRVRLDGQSQAQVQLTLSCDFFAADCSGASLGGAALDLQIADTAGEWLAFEQPLSAPAGAASALCGFQLRMIDGVFDAFLDDLFFGLPIDLFADSFESGDDSAWSSSAP
ncbi:MAG: hypothetical protein AAF657_06705 [Acidobacteriota bacterium]